jgi:(5-formylfuran-3-yl)methyl phosphate synthase
MTLFLASVRDQTEAETAIAAGADIIDLKDPHQGALGALGPEIITQCVRCVAGRKLVSATIGDLPLASDTVRQAIRATAALGVDYVKVGLFPGSDGKSSLRSLESEATHVRLILVLFADALPDFGAIGVAAEIGAAGLMFDTLGKGAGALPGHIPPARLVAPIAAAKIRGLTVGLAGSLGARHVPALLALEPDLLGFRGALCRDGNRRKPLDASRLEAIRALIPLRPSVSRQVNSRNLLLKGYARKRASVFT